MRPEKAIPIQVSSQVCLDVLEHLRKTSDLRPLEHVAALALRSWLAQHQHLSTARGYQWKALFLPEGTELRMRYRGVYFYAKVEGDELVYEDFPVTPHGWARDVTGTVRNAWRDIWIRRSINDCWTQAQTWRKDHWMPPMLDCAERRTQHRRSTD
jgi:hypothetical protein